jgi:hypothetical protein
MLCEGKGGVICALLIKSIIAEKLEVLSKEKAMTVNFPNLP